MYVFLQTAPSTLGTSSALKKLEIDHAFKVSFRHALVPTYKSKLRSILKVCNVYRRFVDKFAHKAGLLHTLHQKNTPEHFTFN